MSVNVNMTTTTNTLRQIYLMKDYPILPTDQDRDIPKLIEISFRMAAIDPEGVRIPIYAKDFDLTPCVPDLTPDSEFISKIHGHVAKLKRSDLLMFVLKVFRNEDNEVQLDFNLRFLRRRVQQLCEILPQPCLQVTVKGQPHQEVTATFVKQFELYDILYDLENLVEDTWKRYELFATPSDMDREAKLDIVLGWMEPLKPKIPPIQMGVPSFMQTLLGRESSKDLTIVAGNGAQINCHSVIFEAHGDVLAAMISSKNGMLEGATGTINMKENSEEGLSLLIRYFYGTELTGDDLSSAEVAVELFGTAHKYLLVELQKSLGELLLRKGRDWYSPGALIELYFQVKNLDDWKSLQEHTLDIMLNMSEEIKSCDRFEELGRAEALALVWKLLDMEKQLRNPVTCAANSSSQPTSKRRRVEN